MKDFYTILKDKVAVKPSREFDKKFWACFDAEFNAKPSWIAQWAASWKIWGSGFAIATAALITIFFYQHSAFTRLSQVMTVASIDALSHEEMFSEMDFFEAFDSLPDGIPISDEDWDILLPQGKAKSA
jgi:hypothetical protein